ncbi:MAG TPA: hypothetical protein VLC09_19560 [Polyangiaceae bacterium]|nr:hypothetical protein [Polyangiaceae bacterium]
MILHSELLERVERGAVSVAFLRLQSGSLASGQRVRCARGTVVVLVVKPIDAETLRECDAHRAGYPSREALLAELAARVEDGVVHRLELRVEPD